jgi:hypothetical protein
MRRAVDMWTMRCAHRHRPWTTPAALPTVGAFAHMPTAFDDNENDTKNTPRPCADPARVGQIYFGDNAGKWVRFTSALTRA